MVLERDEWTLLSITLADGDSFSPVQLQKSAFLFGKLLPSEVLPSNYYKFSPYNYGPFDVEVYKDTEALAQQGLVAIDPASNYGYSEYSATAEGIDKGLEFKRELPKDVASQAQEIVEWVRKQSFRGLVSAIYEQYPEYRVNSVFSG